MGELTGYVLGYSGGTMIRHEKTIKGHKEQIHKKGMLAIFFLSLLPNPFFDFIGIAAGALKIPWWQFLLPCLLGKVIRFIMFLTLISLGVSQLNWWFM